MVPLCKGDRQRALVDSAVQASITLGAVVEPGLGPNGTLQRCEAQACNLYLYLRSVARATFFFTLHYRIRRVGGECGRSNELLQLRMPDIGDDLALSSSN